MNPAEIRTAIERLSFEERAGEQMKGDIASGKLDGVLREVEAARVREMP